MFCREIYDNIKAAQGFFERVYIPDVAVFVEMRIFDAPLLICDFYGMTRAYKPRDKSRSNKPRSTNDDNFHEFLFLIVKFFCFSQIRTEEFCAFS